MVSAMYFVDLEGFEPSTSSVRLIKTGIPIVPTVPRVPIVPKKQRFTHILGQKKGIGKDGTVGKELYCSRIAAEFSLTFESGSYVKT